MEPGISHDWEEETPEAKVRWFRFLTMEERMDYLCWITDLILEINPEAASQKPTPPASERVIVLTLPSN